MILKAANLQWSDEGILKSLDFDDIYFQPEAGFEESSYVFLEKNNIKERISALKDGDIFEIAELGFGSGLNFLLTLKLWAELVPEGARLNFTSFEKHPIAKADLQKIYASWGELKEFSDILLEQYPLPIEGFYRINFLKWNVSLNLLFGDAADSLPEHEGSFDAWYLDGFAPAKNPDMWGEDLLRQIAAKTKFGGTFATFSAAGDVKRSLEAAGFNVEKTKGFGTKRDMLQGSMPKISAPAIIDKSKRVTVLGAGIAGTSAAFSLARKGYKVEIIERRNNAGVETSGNPIGIAYQKVTVDKSHAGDFYAAGFAYTYNLANAVKPPYWNACGVLHMPIDKIEQKRYKALGEQGYPAEFLSNSDKGLFQPMGGYLSPPRLCRKLLEHPNITARFDSEIASLDDLDFDTLIIASGHHSKKFKETAWLPLHSLRGQVTFLRANAESEQLKCVVCHDGYITPAVEGVHYIGATFQREEPDSEALRYEDHVHNLNNLNKYMPELELAEKDIVGGKTGYRTATPDSLPLIGRLPDYGRLLEDFADLRRGKEVNTPRSYVDNVYVATGYGSHGMSTAPLGGEFIACQIAGESLPLPKHLLDYIAPERFVLRDLRRRKI